MNVFVISAHYDDETLGCGGTIARLSAEGHSVHIHILGEGYTSRSGEKSERTLWLRQNHEAVKILGAQVWFNGACGFPDNQMDSVPLLEVAKRIETMLGTVKPDVVYTHNANDLNQDHRIVHQATLIATRPTADCKVKEVYAYEVPSSTEWVFSMNAFQPNVFVDISNYLEKKIQAMEMYKTERREFPHPRSPEALRALATWRGAQSGCMAAEAFQLVRWVQ